MKRFHFVFAGLIVLSLVLCGCSRQGEQSKIAEKWVENETAAASSHDVEKQISFYTDDLLYEDLALNKTFHGKEEFSVFIKGIVTTIPDLKVVAKSFFVSGNKVCIEGILSGTYRGNIPPAVGKTFSVRCAHICELRDGKAFRVTDYYDRASI